MASELEQLDAADRERDKRLRRRMLFLIHTARIAPEGGISGRRIVDLVSANSADAFEGDGHAMGLLMDLERKGLIEVRDLRTRRSQIYSLDYQRALVTAMGSSLIRETIPPDADIDDERNM